MAERATRSVAAPVKPVRGRTPRKPAPGAAAKATPAARRTSATRRPPPPPPRMLVPRWLSPLTLGLCVAGIGVAGYLTAAHYTTAKILACSGHGIVNCDAVTTSPQSMIFGIPVAVLGLLFFVGALPFMLPVAWRSANPWVHRARLGGAVVGVGMVAYLVYTELFTIGNICLYCTAVHVLTVLLFVAVVIGSALSVPDVPEPVLTD
jgi:uncharacterized membrane protein